MIFIVTPIKLALISIDCSLLLKYFPTLYKLQNDTSMRKLFLSVLIVLAGCTSKPSVSVLEYGNLSTGEPVHKYVMTNASGSTVEVCDFGARFIAVNVPDREGNLTDIVIGFDDIASIEAGQKTYRFMGCVIGRYANRIAGPAVTIDGQEYEIECNENRGAPVQLHGGDMGFDRYLWDAQTIEEKERCGVRFTRLSPDGEAGLPGNVMCAVTYWLYNNNTCSIEYEAETDMPTFVNLSNHTYFNLKGYQAGNVIDHIFMMDADSCIMNNRQSIPETIMAVEGTPFDFRTPNRFDYRMTKQNAGKVRNGSWIVNDWDGSLKKIADLYAPDCGRGVEVWSTEPNLVTETCGSVNGTVMGKGGRLLQQYDGMLLETIHMADSPHQSRFPSTLLRPGEKYHSLTEYRFYTK